MTGRNLVWGLSVAACLIWLAGCGGGGGGQSDTTPPQILSVSVLPSLVEEGSTMQAEAVVTDAGSGIASVRALVRYPNGTEQTYEMQRSSNGRFTRQWNVPNGVSGEQNVILITIIALDMQGNSQRFDHTPAPRLARQPPAPPW